MGRNPALAGLRFNYADLGAYDLNSKAKSQSRFSRPSFQPEFQIWIRFLCRCRNPALAGLRFNNTKKENMMKKKTSRNPALAGLRFNNSLCSSEAEEKEKSMSQSRFSRPSFQLLVLSDKSFLCAINVAIPL